MENSPGSTPSMDIVMQEIQSLRNDLHRFIERTNQIHINAIVSDLKNEYTDLISKHHMEQAQECLSNKMVQDCAMNSTCFKFFFDFLTAVSKHIKDGQITEEIISSYETQLEELKKKGRFERCKICFGEVYRLFGKQIDLMRSLGILHMRECTAPVTDFPDEKVVTEIIKPITSITRFQILQAVSGRTKIFSDLSHLTKLRGGNLLFHIRRLQEAGMVIQRHERGDYIITEKGFRVLSSIRDIYEHLEEDH